MKDSFNRKDATRLGRGLCVKKRSIMKAIIFIISILFIVSCQQKDEKVLAKFDWDKDGMLVIDGKRTFIIGSYHLPKTDDPYRTLHETGYNLIRIPAEEDALDAAQKNQLYTWLGTGAIQVEKKEEDEKRISELVRKYKDHPSLLIWEIADEPAFTWNSPDYRISAEQMIKSYQLVKTEDPDHLIYTNHGPVNLISTLKKYNPATDIVACDVYPVIPQGITPTFALFDDGLQGDLLNPYISQVGDYVDKMMQVVDREKPLFMVLQGFAWEMLKEAGERNPEMILYPTYEESRFMAYNAIIDGAVGINYWGTSYTPQPSPFMDDLNIVTMELAEMQPVLSAPETRINIGKEYHELGYSVDVGVEVLAKKAGGILYLITVNSDKNPVKVTLSGLDDFVSAIVLKENRTVTISSGKLTDHYKPFDVHIYQLK